MSKQSVKSLSMRVGAVIAVAGGIAVADVSMSSQPAEAGLGCLYTDLRSSSVNNITCGRLAHGHKDRPSPTAPTVRSGNWVGMLSTSKSGVCYAYPAVVKG